MKQQKRQLFKKNHQAPTNEFVPPSIDNSQNVDTQGPTLLEQMQQPIIETQPTNNVPSQNELQLTNDNNQSVTPIDQVQQPIEIQSQPIDNTPVQNEPVQATIDNNQNISVQSATPLDQVQQPTDVQAQPNEFIQSSNIDSNQNIQVSTPLDQVQQPPTN